ncbi:hypothetical protein [Halomonas denitrificans]|uniref:hypothetical protein n=1 Tax=Halomonas denitrificans TaxID=370769 RepID=UPI001C991BD6|nr:hypothetical protein [Halomonas denitrificans]MBY5967247.1 hypothetical protein [Halomonas denitrificans]
MIYESSYWKEPLLKTATWLRRVRLGKNVRESTLIKVEKELFIGFYSVRKLLETVKVSDSTKKEKFELIWHPNKKPVDWLNHHVVEDHYDLEKSSQESKGIGFVCNLFIHSYVFTLVGENKIEGVFVASDKTKNQKVYYVPIEVISSVFRLVGRDYPSRVEFTRNAETGEFEAKAW